MQSRMGGKVNEKKVAAQAVKDADKARKTEAAIAADWADPTLARRLPQPIVPPQRLTRLHVKRERRKHYLRQRTRHLVQEGRLSQSLEQQRKREGKRRTTFRYWRMH